MEKEIKKVEEVKQPQTKQLKDITTMELESIAFKIGEQIKATQRQYNEVYTELIKRKQEESKNGGN